MATTTDGWNNKVLALKEENAMLRRALAELTKQLDEVNALLATERTKNEQLERRNKILREEKLALQKALRPYISVVVE